MKALQLLENLPRHLNDEGKFDLLQGSLQSSPGNVRPLFSRSAAH
jgi:hypothetical protein